MSNLKDKITAILAAPVAMIQEIITSRAARAAGKWCRSHRAELIRHAIVILIVVILCMTITNRPSRTTVVAAETEPVIEEIEAVVPQPTPYVNPQYKAEAEAIARVLYGIRENSEQDLRTYIWCILNRVDNPSSEFDNTLTEVIGKPSQWMFYDPSSPVVESLYHIAYEEVLRWHEDHRPCSCDFVYAEWSYDDIVLRNTWEYNKNTETWWYGK